MTVPSSTSRDQQVGNGVTVAFTVPFRILDQTHLRVLLTVAGVTTEQTLTTHYSVSGVGGASTTVTFVTAPASLALVTFLRNVPFTQETDYVPNDPFPAESHERALDKLTMQVQQLNEAAGEDGRTIKIPPEVSGVSTTLPIPVAGGLWGWNAAGDAPRYYTASEIGTTLAFSNFIADAFTAAAAQTDFTLSADPGALANLDVSIDGVTQVPTTDYTLDGTTLTFTSAMAGGEKVLVRYGTALPTGITDSVSVNYTPPSTGVAGTVKSFLDSLWTAGASAGAALVRFLQAGASAVARTIQDKLRDHVHVKDFGATGDGITNDTDAILAAIAEAKDRGGAVVEFHGGTFLISETLVVDAPGIILRGRGVAGSASGGGGGKASYRSGASTRILWGGNATGPMYRLTSNAADDGTVSGIQGNAGVEGMLFDCAEVCARGIEIRSWTYATFRHVGVCYATEYGWLITTLENGVPSGAADTQHCEFFHCSYNEINTANPCDAGMVIGKGGSQTSQGNVSLCSFYNLHINVEGPGLALSLENVDNLYFFFYRGQNRTGVGGGGQTVFQAITTGFINQGALLTGPARYCMFFSCSGEFIAKEEPGTGTGSYGNMIFGLTRANGRPLPVVEEGASLVCFETGGSGTAVPLGGSVTGRRRRGHLAHIAATTSIPNGTETGITSYNDTYNTESASLGSGVAGITVPNGVYNCAVEVQASWAVSATGWRQVTLLKNGAVVNPNVFTKANAPGSGGAYVKAVVTDLDVVPGDVLSLSVQHSAGGALNLTAADSWIRVRWY